MRVNPNLSSDLSNISPRISYYITRHQINRLHGNGIQEYWFPQCTNHRNTMIGFTEFHKQPGSPSTVKQQHNSPNFVLAHGWSGALQRFSSPATSIPLKSVDTFISYNSNVKFKKWIVPWTVLWRDIIVHVDQSNWCGSMSSCWLIVGISSVGRQGCSLLFIASQLDLTLRWSTRRPQIWK